MFEKVARIVTLLFLTLNSTSLLAQDIEPRRWSVLPLNSDVLGLGYSYTFGELLFDPVLETKDVSLDINTILVSYIKSFKIGDKFARIDLRLPYSFQNFEGLVSDVPTTQYRSGFGDARIRFSMNFTGAPAGNIKEIQEYVSSNSVYTTFGASVAITVPTGQYFEDKLINIGQNQWVIRPQVGFVHNWRSWSYELTGSVYFFSNNNNFFGGVSRKQDPILAFQTHLIKRFNQKMWASISCSYGLGGESEVNSIASSDFRTNILTALSGGTKVSKFESIKLVYLYSATLKDIGSNTHSLILGWTHLFL